MNTRRIQNWFRRVGSFRRKRSNGFFHDADEFRDILQQERLRSDRSGRTFSVVILWLHERQVLEQNLAYLETEFAHRLRATDRAGFLRGHKIGVMLPHTTASGAWKLADDLRTTISKRVDRLNCEVFEYPNTSPPAAGEREASSQPAGELIRETQTTSMKLTSWCGNILDVTVAAGALVLLSPLMLTAALAIKLTSPGPVLFRQQREGYLGKPFAIYKFRTMCVGADAMQAELRDQSEQEGPAFKMTNDPRVTPIGRFLRTTSIDEMPQLFNVLRRDMSLVGPRPLPVEESRSCDLWQRRRLAIRPGITCIWQVQGRSSVSFEEWMRMDLQYVQTRSLGTDLSLLFRTVPAVLSRKGAK